MGEMLTIEEIRERHAPFWVPIDEPRVDGMQGLHGGRVVFNSTDGDDIDRKATEPGLKRIAVRYPGTWPDDMAFVP